MTVWTALDDATIEKGCVQVIPGSHKLGLFSEHGHTIAPEQEAQYARDALTQANRDRQFGLAVQKEGRQAATAKVNAKATTFFRWTTSRVRI